MVNTTLFNADFREDYEIGRVLARAGDVDSARKHFELVLSGKRSASTAEKSPPYVHFCHSGKTLEINASTRKVCSRYVSTRRNVLLTTVVGQI